jgi:hypothetical protein
MDIKTILYVGYLNSGHHAALRARTLTEMGYSVILFDANTFAPNNLFNKINYHLNTSFGLQKINKELCIQFELIKPDLVWCDKTPWLNKKTLQKMKGIHDAILIHYNPDDPFGNFSKGWATFKKAIPYYDLHLVAREVNILEYSALKAKKVIPFDRSFDPFIHKPMVLNSREQDLYNCEVGFIGAYAKDRAESISSLIRNNIPVSIYGNGWPDKEEWNTIKPYYKGPSIYEAQYAKAICGMKIALHFLRHENRDEQDSRTFEIPACGSFMLAERTNTHKRLFEEDIEAAYFSDNEELFKKVKYYLDNPVERQKIAENGYKKCISSYDHTSRLKQLLKNISELNS